MKLEEFCVALDQLKLSNTDNALAILWFMEREKPDTKVKGGELARIITKTGLGSPHSTRLTESVKKTKLVLSSSAGLQLKPTAKQKIYELIKPILKHKQPKIDHGQGFITEEIWQNTRTYIEKIATQINGCYEYSFFDGASILIRRLIETLLIECFEHLKKENDIKESDGNYMMLSGLIKVAVDNGGLTLGRETKKALSKIKKIGDNAAHNRRYLTTKNDLDELKVGIRIAVQELLMIANLIKSST